jgi:hypothetical protein
MTVIISLVAIDTTISSSLGSPSGPLFSPSFLDINAYDSLTVLYRTSRESDSQKNLNFLWLFLTLDLKAETLKTHFKIFNFFCKCGQYKEIEIDREIER